jgi:hypothetical protein
MRDVFVEGEFDQAIVRWFVDACCSDGLSVGVYPIDEIDVPAGVLKRYGLNTSNRSEVIALSLELESHFGSQFTRVTGVIDKDTAGLVDDVIECDLILKSDFSCVEMYLLGGKCLPKVLKLAFPNLKLSANDVITQLAPVLRELFLIRAANQSMGWNAKWIPLDSFVSVENRVIAFRLADYQRHYLQGSDRWGKRSDFESRVAILRSKLPGDLRFEANGHDAICLLSQFLKSVSKKAKEMDKTRPHVLVHLLTCSLEVSDLQEQPMFKQLLQRLSAEPTLPISGT